VQTFSLQIYKKDKAFIHWTKPHHLFSSVTFFVHLTLSYHFFHSATLFYLSTGIAKGLKTLNVYYHFDN